VHLDKWEGTGTGKIATKSAVVSLLQYGLLKYWHFSGVEAGVKFRPTEAELKVLGPGFRSRWESFYENQPDKPIGMLVSVAGYVLLSCAEFFFLLIIHQFTEVCLQVSLEILLHGLQHCEHA
jgi:hypothetical protein